MLWMRLKRNKHTAKSCQILIRHIERILRRKWISADHYSTEMLTEEDMTKGLVVCKPTRELEEIGMISSNDNAIF